MIDFYFFIFSEVSRYLGLGMMCKIPLNVNHYMWLQYVDSWRVMYNLESVTYMKITVDCIPNVWISMVEHNTGEIFFSNTLVLSHLYAFLLVWQDNYAWQTNCTENTFQFD